MNSQQALQWALSHNLLDPNDARITPLQGGLVNRVWHASDNQQSIVLKHTTDHLTSNPTIPLDPHRGHIEIHALQHASQWLNDTSISTPKVLAFDLDEHIFAMSFIENAIDLETWLQSPHATHTTASLLGTRLGTDLHTLHTTSAQHPQHAHTLNNAPVQKTRAHVQYNAIASWFDPHSPHTPTPRALQNARTFGHKCTLPGHSLIHGDLWTRSILLQNNDPNRAHLIDWEFAHWGRPAQDLGHLTAHLYLLEHTTQNAHALRKAFIAAYTPLSPKDAHETAIHAACEILIRTAGPFAPPSKDAPPSLVQTALLLLDDPTKHAHLLGL